MQCGQCSTEIPDEAKFCPACGHKFTSTASSPSADDKDSFALADDDFGRALRRAAEDAGVDVPADLVVNDPISLQQAGETLGLDKLKVQQALHRISMEKLPEDVRKKMGVVLDDEVEPQGRPWWMIPVAGLFLVGVGIAVWALFLRPPPERPVVEMQPQKGTIDVDALNTGLDVLSAQAQACYQTSLKKAPKLKGEVLLTLRIGLDGKATASLGSSLDGDAGATASECMRAAAEGVTWPAAQTAPVDVDIPFSFAPAE